MKALLRKIRQILRDRKTRRIFTRLVSTVAAIVVFVTTYALVLPAITMEREAACGIEAHQHDQSCYTDVLVCEIPESPGHVHDESCYSTKQKQVCQIEEHVHDSYCYDENGELICENTEHQHGEDCFEEVRELVCEIPESSGHQHDDSCYQKVLTCGKEVHTHSAACYHADTASQAATEAIAVASTESATAAATGNGLVDNLNAPAEYSESETSLDSSTENSVVEGGLDASPDNSLSEKGTTALTDEVSADEPGVGASKEATADATAATAASTGSGAGVTGSTAATTGSSTDGTAATAAPVGATDTMSVAAGYVPVLDKLNFDTLLNKHTGIYYSWLAGTDSAVDNETNGADAAADTGETQAQEPGSAANISGTQVQEVQEPDAAANTGEIQAPESDTVANVDEAQKEAAAENTGELQEVATWNRTDKHTELKESDNLRLYLAYTIPAGSLNETNQTARYSLPQNIHLTDEQVDKINATVNGIAGQYVSYDTLEILDQEMYGKYLGNEAVEGTRTPADDLDEYLANNEGQEFISATVKVENVFDENTGLLKAQDLVFTFAPYTIQKNQHQYDSEGKPTKAGEEVNGWLAIDISTEQIDWENADDETKTADIIFVEKDKKSDLKEIRTELRLVETEADFDADTNAGNAADGVSSDPAATDNKQDGTKDSETAAGESDKAEKEQVNYPSVSFDDSITVAGGVLPTDTDEASGDAGMAAETEITVHVEADKDTFPEGTTMVLSAVSDDQMTAVAEAVEGAVDAPKTMGFHAVDISFRDVKGNEIEPLKPIRVSMTSDAIRRAVQDESTTPVVVHVSDSSADQDAADENTDDGGSTDAADADEAEGADSQPILDSSESTDEQVSGSDLETTPEANIIEIDTGTKENNGDTLTFDADAFSVYAIVYTVDFHWEVDGKMYAFGIPGGGFVSLEHLVEVLGIGVSDANASEIAENITDEVTEYVGEAQEPAGTYDEAIKLNEVKVSEATRKFVADVESVEFSGPELVWVGKVNEDASVGGLKEANGLETEYSADLTEEQIAEINAQTVEAGDWALISMQPFTSEKTLTVTMKNGEQFVVRVTDAQISTHVITADGEDYIITVTYGPEAEIPDGAKLTARELVKGTEEYQKYYEETLQALNLTDAMEDNAEEGYVQSIVQARFFDISIYAGEKEIEPNAPVSVEITYQGKAYSACEEVSVVHFAKSGLETIAPVASAKGNDTIISFEQESFSVTGTVVNQTDITNGDYYIIHREGENWYALASDGSYVDVTANYDNASSSVVDYTGTKNITWHVNSTGENYYIIKAVGEEKYITLNGTVVGDNSGAVSIHSGTYESPKNAWITRDVTQYVYRGVFDYYGSDYRYHDSALGWNNGFSVNNDNLWLQQGMWGRIYLMGGQEASGTNVQFAKLSTNSGELGGNYPNKTYNIDQLDTWLGQAMTDNPIQETLKTASVYDYDNRIYQIDLSTKSAVLAMASDISLGFVTDVSNSMLFPSSLTPVSGKINIKLNSSNLNSLPHNNGEVYFTIADASVSSTVFAIYYDNGWKAMDASYYAKWKGKGVAPDSAHGATSIGSNNVYLRTDPNTTNYTIYTANDEFFSGLAAHNIYDMTQGNMGNRLYYLEKSIADSVADLKSIAAKYPLGGIYAALETFAGKSESQTVQNRINYLKIGGYSADMTAANTSYANNYTTLYNALSSITTADGTMQNVALSDSTFFGSPAGTGGYIYNTSAEQKYVILVTDGAPNGSGANVDSVVAAAKTLRENGINVITIGLSIEDVTNADRMLYWAASAIDSNGNIVTNPDTPNDLSSTPSSSADKRLFYWAKTGEDLTWIMREIVRTVMREAIVSATIKDEISEVFYPVSEDGTPLGNGDWIKADGTKCGTADPDRAGKITFSDGKYTVEWTEQDASWTGWNGKVYVKAKEDFLGGNNITTNDECSVTPVKYTTNKGVTGKEKSAPFSAEVQAAKKVEPPTPCVNVDELHMTENSTDFTVYLGTEVDPATELRKLWNEIKVIEVVKENGTKSGYTIKTANDMYYPTDGANKASKDDIFPQSGYDAIPLSHYGLNESILTDLLTAIKTSNSATSDPIAYAPYGQGNVGTITVKLEKTVNSQAQGKAPDPHETEVVSGTTYVERYVLTITYTPLPAEGDSETQNRKSILITAGKVSETDTDYKHNGTNGPGNETDESTSTNIHRIYVFAKGLMVYKKDEFFTRSLSGAEFKLYRSAVANDPETSKKTLKGLEGKYVLVSVLDNLEEIYAEYGIEEGYEGIFASDYLKLLKEGGQYYLVESKAPDGYIAGDPMPVTITISNMYAPVPPGNQYSEVMPETNLYNIEQEAILTITGVNAHLATATGEDIHGTGGIPDHESDYAYYLISNNPGATLPNTGGPGTMPIYLLGILLAGISGAGLVMQKRRRTV